ncbi:MAG TPA: acetyl-CoA C-acyltransferase, partial [Gammaproteobacteria bacterium]|nr:acetyl-CoA C-acyltransferase [Gammaproteobacteria bacterium]
AEIVGERYNVSREAQDEFSAQSQARTAAAQQAGAFDDEIVALPSVMKLMNKETGEVNEIEVNLDKDEGNRPTTTLDALSGLQPVFSGGQVIQEGRHV